MAEIGGPGNVSQRVIDAVKNVMKIEGSKRKIDSEKEVAELGNLLNGGLSNAEKDYVQGFIDGYNTELAAQKEEEAQRELESSITPNLKKELKDIVNKKGYVDIEGAKVLADKLATADLNQFERKYIEGILVRSGFEHMIPVKEVVVEKTVTNAVDTIPEEKDKTVESGHEGQVNKQEAQDAEKAPTTNTAPAKTKKAPVKPHSIQIPRAFMLEGEMLADKFKQNAGKFFANTDGMLEQLSRLDDKNAYHFFKKFNYSRWINEYGKTTEKAFDPFDTINYENGIKAPVNALLNQAKKCGINESNTFAYKAVVNALKECKKTAEANKTLGNHNDPNNASIKLLDDAIADLLKVMSRYIQVL